MNWKETRLTPDQKKKVIALFSAYKIEADRRMYQVIRDLNMQLMCVDVFFGIDRGNGFYMDRAQVKRDIERVEKIIKIVNSFENEGLKRDFFNSVPASFKYPFTLPAQNEILKDIVVRCGAIHQIVESHTTFKRAKERSLYPFMASLVNILRPGSFTDDLTDGEIKSFKKYLGSWPERQRKVKPHF